MKHHMSEVEAQLPDTFDSELDGDFDHEWDDDPLSEMVEEAMRQYIRDPDNPKWVTTTGKTASGCYIKYLMVGDWFFPIFPKDIARSETKLSYWGKEEMNWLRDVHNGVFEMLLSRGDLLDYCKRIEDAAIDNQIAIRAKLQREWGDEEFFSRMDEANTIAKENTRMNIIEKLPDKLEDSYALHKEENTDEEG